MHLSRVDFYNLALERIKVGERVRSIDDKTARKFLLAQSWEITLGNLLSRHNWRFATVSQKLARVDNQRSGQAYLEEAEVEVAPASIYLYSWVYPTDCQKLISVGIYRKARQDGVFFFDFGVQSPWTTEAGPEYTRIIRTTHANACAQYITNKVPEVKWPPNFADAFLWALAAQITRAINASDSDSEYRLQQAEQAFQTAVAFESGESGRAIQRHGNWIESRSEYGRIPPGDHNLFGAYGNYNGDI